MTGGETEVASFIVSGWFSEVYEPDFESINPKKKEVNRLQLVKIMNLF